VLHPLRAPMERRRRAGGCKSTKAFGKNRIRQGIHKPQNQTERQHACCEQNSEAITRAVLRAHIFQHQN
jgi:hypothetical protein